MTINYTALDTTLKSCIISQQKEAEFKRTQEMLSKRSFRIHVSEILNNILIPTTNSWFKKFPNDVDFKFYIFELDSCGWFYSFWSPSRSYDHDILKQKFKFEYSEKEFEAASQKFVEHLREFGENLARYDALHHSLTITLTKPKRESH